MLINVKDGYSLLLGLQIWKLRAWRLISSPHSQTWATEGSRSSWWEQWGSLNRSRAWGGGSSRHRAWGVHRAPQSPETTDPPKWSKHIQVVQGPPELPGMFVPCRSNLHFSWGKALCTRCAVLTVWMELVSLEISGIFRWRLCSTYVVCI